MKSVNIAFMTIGDKIRQKRQQFNITQEKLAELLGVTWKTIYRWEKDIAIPRHEMVKKMAEIFDVSPAWFLSNKWVEPGVEPQDIDPAILEIPPDVLDVLKDKRMQEVVRILAPYLSDEIRLHKIIKLLKLVLDECEQDRD